MVGAARLECFLKMPARFMVPNNLLSMARMPLHFPWVNKFFSHG